MFVRVVAGGRTERKKQDPSPTSCRDRSKPAVPPCLTLARPLYAYANMPTFVNGASAPARILATRLSARPRKSIRSRSACRDPSARDSLKDDLGTYLPFLIGLLDCSTAKTACQGVFQKKFFEYGDRKNSHHNKRNDREKRGGIRRFRSRRRSFLRQRAKTPKGKARRAFLPASFLWRDLSAFRYALGKRSFRHTSPCRCRPFVDGRYSMVNDCFSTGLLCFFGRVSVRTPLSSFALMPSRSISETSNDRLYSP